MLPVGQCQVPHPLQAETTVVGSQQGLRCGSICLVTTGQESVVNCCATALIPYRFLIHAVKARALKKRSCRTILSNARSCQGVVFQGAPEDLPGTKDPVAACLLSMWLTVVKPTQAAIAPWLMPSRASANTSCLIHIGVGQGIVRTIRKTFEKICKYWFKVVTVWKLIWGNDHLYCGFRARRSHLTWHWMSAEGSVGFRWGTITDPYHANFSQVETQTFDPHWFYCLQLGCNNNFCQECKTVYHSKTCVRNSIGLTQECTFHKITKCNAVTNILSHKSDSTKAVIELHTLSHYSHLWVAAMMILLLLAIG